MDIKAGRIVQSTQTNLCKNCKQEIHPEAKKCHHCGKYQKLRWAFRGHFPLIISVSISIITLLYLYKQVNIASEQTNIAKIQVEETRAKRIEASKVLEEVQEVKDNAESVLLKADDALKKSDSVLKDANAKVEQVSSKVNGIGEKVQKADKSINTFTKRQKELSEDVNEIKTELTAELKKLKERNEIVALADNAISNGDTASYEELYRRLNKLNEDNELYDVTVSSILRIKNFYMMATRVIGGKISYKKSGGTIIKLDNLTTERLIKGLLKNHDWRVRNKIALLLRKRKEKGVPDALIKGMEDRNLDVRRACIVSFNSLTGYKNPDVLEYNKLIEWWSEHKEEWESKLPK